MIKKYWLHGWAVCLVIFIGLLHLPPGGGSLPERAPQAAAAEADVGAYTVLPEALVSLTFDDYSQSVYDTAFPILDAQGIPGTYYFISSALTDLWRAQLNDLENQGWEIGSHSQTHRDLTTLSDAELITELTQSKTDLEAAGLNISGFAYPEGKGSKDNRVLRLVKQYYAYGRATTPGYNQPIINQYTLRIQSQVVSTSLETMKSWVDEAVADRQWLVILMHSVDNSGNLYTITPQDLADLNAYIHEKVEAGSLHAITTREGIARLTQAAWQPIDRIADFSGQNLVLTNGRVLWYFGNDQVVDYLYDGFEWVKSGKIQYWEWHGDYHLAGTLSAFMLDTLDSERSAVQFTLTDSMNGDFSVVSTVFLGRGRPLAEVKITAVQGTPPSLMLGKYLARRFSTLEGRLLTDGMFEHGPRDYGESALRFTVFDQNTDLIRAISQRPAKIYAEYADYQSGEFRIREISRTADLPYTWCVGGIPFDTLHLLTEAEDGILHGAITSYAGEDASPGIEATGVVLDASGEIVNLQFTPPQPGSYLLSIRQKGAAPGAAFSLHIDGRAPETHLAAEGAFGYTSFALPDLAAEMHTVSLAHQAGTVILDYALLVPTARSASTPAGVLFPADLHCAVCTFLPLTFQGIQD
jgi:peptidoglycan/xylan/chitin deacetylase (PgdA/CDA1 family)